MSALVLVREQTVSNVTRMDSVRARETWLAKTVTSAYQGILPWRRITRTAVVNVFVMVIHLIVNQPGASRVLTAHQCFDLDWKNGKL